MDKNDEHRYDDMLRLPHHVSRAHPQMAVSDRAAQFAPFATLSGYGSAIRETARLTDDRIEPGDCAGMELDEKLRIVRDCLSEHPVLSVTHFRPDERKAGGAYVVATGEIWKIQEFERTLVLRDGTVIPIDEILAIDGELFSQIDF